MRAMPSTTTASTSISSSTSSSVCNFTDLRRTSNKRGSSGKVRKSGKEKREKKETLEQLKDLVPTVNRDQPMNKLELLQHVSKQTKDIAHRCGSRQMLNNSRPHLDYLSPLGAIAEREREAEGEAERERKTGGV
uniref:BHLH domain-containing protein n=1 Tax=Plectus sambesii TaxID=2011161 RepID=A0A914WKW2_9BILA